MNRSDCLLNGRFDPAEYRGNRVDDGGIEVGATRGRYFGEGFLHRPGRAIWALVRQRIEKVRDRDDARLDRNPLARMPVGISGAIPPLVMTARNALRHLDQRGMSACQHRRSYRRVRLHDAAFLVREGSGLEQDRIRNSDLSNVVKRRRATNQIDLARRQSNSCCNQRGEVSDPVRMLACIIVPKFSCSRQALEDLHLSLLELARTLGDSVLECFILLANRRV